MKKIIVMTLVTLVMIWIFVGPGYAGSRHGHLMEGILIGTGAVILGSALVNGIHHDDRVAVKVASRRDYRSHNRRFRHPRAGRVWIEPRYDDRWNPGHYNRRGRWVKGRHERVVVRQGFWKKMHRPRHR